jgi:hypothetical protein
VIVISRKCLLSLALCILFAASHSAAALQLEVIAKPSTVIAGLKDPQIVGDLLIVSEASKPDYRSAMLIYIETDAANVEVEIEDSTRSPVSADQVADGVWMLSTPGKYWVEVTAIDFSKNIYSKKKLTVEVGKAPQPPPGPDPPGPGPGPTPPPDVDVLNEYGLGQALFQSAPRSAAELRAYAEIYRRAADFLYGIPSLKAVIYPGGFGHGDPARDVAAWINSQTAAVQCTSPEICRSWGVWRGELNRLVQESQNRRGHFTREDWFAAFREISAALDAAAKGTR